MKHKFSPTDSHWRYIPGFRAGSVPSRWSTQDWPLEVLCLTICFRDFLFKLTGSCLYILTSSFMFLWDSYVCLGLNVFLILFPWLLFLCLLVLSYSGLFVSVLVYFAYGYDYLDTWWFFNKRQKRCGFGREVGRILEELEEKTVISEYILWKKSIFRKIEKLKEKYIGCFFLWNQITF